MSLERVDATKKIVELRTSGHDWGEISGELGITAARAKEKFNEYMAQAFDETSEREMRFLQLKRLESMITFLWDQVKGGDALTEGRQTANLLKVIEEINKLMGLYYDPLKQAQAELTQAQTTLVYEVLTTMRTALLERVIGSLRQTGTQIPPETMEALGTLVNAQWSQWYHDAAEQAMATVTTAAIEPGGNA